MIRRHVGDQFLLIAQDDHASLSGAIARHFGNRRFAAPQPAAETIDAISAHDCGWALHDEHPTLNAAGLPLDVFECPLSLSLQLWSAGADRAQSRSAYTALLVSLHVLGLSALAAAHPHSREEVFLLNRFQHREIERQESLRRTLGLHTDRPTELGLGIDERDPAERRLKRNHAILQLHDRLSLALCCTDPPIDHIEGIVPAPGEPALTLHLRRTAPTSIELDPWPFDKPELLLEVPYHPVPARTYVDLPEFREAYARSPAQQLQLRLHSCQAAQAGI